jgi:O-antigen/teichoic acid export membrane protein
MSRTRRFLAGVSFGYLNQALVMLTGLWLTPFLLHRLGQRDYGLWLVGTQIVAYLGLLDLGVVALLPRETAYASGRAQREPEAQGELPLLVGRTLRIVLWQMPLVLAAAVIAWWLMPEEWQPLRGPVGLLLIGFVIFFPLRTFAAVLQGLQDLSFLGRLSLISFLVGTAVTVSFAWRGFGLHALALGGLTQQSVGVVAAWWRLRKNFPEALPQSLPPVGWADLASAFSKGGWVSINQVAVMLVSGVDLLIIGKLLGPAAIVTYACTGKLISVMTNQPAMLMQVASPVLSEMRGSESRERLRQVSAALSQAMLMMSGGVVCLVLVINQGFVSAWVGGEQYGGTLLSLLLLTGMLLRHWNTTLVYSIFCFGFERRIAVTTLVDGLVTAVTIYSLVAWLGSIGAPLGGIIGVCAISLPGHLMVLAREHRVSVLVLVKPLLSWSLRFSVLIATSLGCVSFWKIQGVGQLILAAALVGSCYGLAMLPLLRRDPLRGYLLPRWSKLRLALSMTAFS